MKEPDWTHCSGGALWHYVAAHLTVHGIDTVLVGGGAAAVHSIGAYQSGDLDLLVDSFPAPSAGQMDRAMAATTGTPDAPICSSSSFGARCIVAKITGLSRKRGK